MKEVIRLNEFISYETGILIRRERDCRDKQVQRRSCEHTERRWPLTGLTKWPGETNQLPSLSWTSALPELEENKYHLFYYGRNRKEIQENTEISLSPHVPNFTLRFEIGPMLWRCCMRKNGIMHLAQCRHDAFS